MEESELTYEDVLARGIKKMNELRDKPTQYKLDIDTLELLQANGTREERIGFYKYNALKYIMRSKGTCLEDIGKSIDYLHMLEGECKWS